MNSRERYELYKSVGIDRRSPEEVIRRLVNDLIRALYIPTKDGFKVDERRIKYFNIDQEPINWGDLKCIEVSNNLVTIDEASPDECPSFCEYIEEYMKHFGWEIKVVTEW